MANNHIPDLLRHDDSTPDPRFFCGWIQLSLSGDARFSPQVLRRAPFCQQETSQEWKDRQLQGGGGRGERNCYWAFPQFGLVEHRAKVLLPDVGQHVLHVTEDCVIKDAFCKFEK